MKRLQLDQFKHCYLNSVIWNFFELFRHFLSSILNSQYFKQLTNFRFPWEFETAEFNCIFKWTVFEIQLGSENENEWVCLFTSYVLHL